METRGPGWLKRLGGRFVVFDGPDGSGKSTQCGRFAELVERAGVRVCRVREPGGTEIGEQIRRVLLDRDHVEMDLRCEMLLYMASRAQLVAERIGPALAEGQLVLADRFVSSTLAYQGSAGGLDEADILSVGKVAVGGCWPDVVVIFDVPAGAAAKRLGASPRKGKSRRGGQDEAEPSLFADRIETRGRAFHELVREGYLRQAKDDPGRYVVIDGRGDEETVFSDLLSQLGQWLAGPA